MKPPLTLERLADNDLPLPRYATLHSAGLDFAACLTRPCKAVDPATGVKTDFYAAPAERGYEIVKHGRVPTKPDCPPGDLALLVASGETVFIPLGFKSSFPDNYCLQIHVRSSIGVRGLVLANGTGIVDADYRGELMAVVRNQAAIALEVIHGERIVQGVLVHAPQGAVSEGPVDETKRGEGGFGSTGTMTDDLELAVKKA